MESRYVKTRDSGDCIKHHRGYHQKNQYDISSSNMPNQIKPDRIIRSKNFSKTILRNSIKIVENDICFNFQSSFD